MHKRLFLLTCFVLSLCFSFAQGEKRLALIIGNSQYSSGELKNAVNDANKVSAKLKTLGFDVILKNNATYQMMDEAIIDFTDKASSYDVALFYYAGHGIQSKGSNYLIPVDDNSIRSEVDLAYKSENVNRILEGLEDSGCKLKIIILDACRNNPFERSWHRSTSSSGLASLNAPKGTLIAYATSPGSVADDGGDAQNSPYTTAFLQTLDKANLSILDFFNEVSGIVSRNTQNNQTPWVAHSPLDGNFKFNQAKAVETKKDITFTLFPSNATIKFGNTTYENGKTLIFNIGATYSYTVEAEGYQSQSGKFTVEQSTSSSMNITLQKKTSVTTTQSDVSTLLAMGNQFYNEKNYTKAVEYYTKAANQGNALAQYNLGNLYKEGKGVVKNEQIAIGWYEKAASQGHKEAKKTLDEIKRMDTAVPQLKIIENDLTAKLENVCDYNGRPTALIKVITTARGLYFHVEGKGFPNVVKVEQKTGEVWVYVSQGVSQGVTEFSVHNRHGNVSAVSSLSSGRSLVEAGKTYKMTLGWDTEKMPQTSTVTGQVVDDKTGEPLICASVQVVGTQLGVVTDINGKFVIKNVPDSASTLRIGYIGYEMEEETIYPSEMKIFMKPESSSSSRKSKKR